MPRPTNSSPRNPQRGFSAVVVGEPHRAFYGNQFGLTVPLFAHYGVELWVPEIGGPIDPENEAHELVMSVFGGMRKGERNRIKLRVRTAMAAQTLLKGRYLGGRPPYGYTLRDLGPHPNPAKAADGKRLHGLTPDDQTAPVVRRIFDEFLAGDGLFTIAEGLTANHVPCPSAHDRARNPHRSGIAWSKSAVRVILTNPRYTGRQVWNKQRTDEVLLDVDDVAMGHTGVMRWNPRDKWVVSKDITHPPLIDDATFEEAQALLSRRRQKTDGERTRKRTRNPYVFRGLIYCAACKRRMQGQYNHGDAYYRCRFPRNTPSSTRSRTPATSTCGRTPSPTRSTPGWPPPSPQSASNERSAPWLTPRPLMIYPPSAPQPGQPSPTATPNLSATEQPSTPEPTRRWLSAGRPNPGGADACRSRSPRHTEQELTADEPNRDHQTGTSARRHRHRAPRRRPR
ncbi:DNA invertase Pin-like site-specific DNA recombinase [Micromonospora sp. A200]|uniref:recombinase family protein n=1 Tax=Micromonospora sp. A200 TaxID=2940568 RepID=UPI002473805A|nr:recombinase family protein [Micromonospora sp. A200]MDH6464156.1 DNA invertase Pin-like site-specific DNA recombinase [Micromonospora sp. A200]